uniref:meiosis regulator and mRNA stability factor 1-like n=1 Tax=Styela clava TaxID=7725 RepID=UPI00193A59C5|nr:meiosis regulator and mRNA stability factor 1-like [Styela clava]
MPMHIPIQQTASNLTCEIGAIHQTCGETTNEGVTDISDTMANALHINNNTKQNIQTETLENAKIMDNQVPPPYSVILPPGSFVQHIGGSVPPQAYHQFSPALSGGMSQFHPVYPINVLSSRDALHSNQAFIQVQQQPTVDQNMQSRPPSNIPEAPWSNHPSTIPPNPPFYWGHFMTTTDKAHGIALASQPFMRRHSIMDDSAVVTPTNVCPPCNLAGIVSATPEFIHPRKPDVPQWLMSPPVGEQDPSIISYAPMMYHNVRVPSVTGIAIPVVGPMGTGVAVGNHINGTEPPKIDSPALVVSPVPFYENSPMPMQQQTHIQDVPRDNGNCDVFCDQSMQANDHPPPPVNVMQFEQHKTLLKPSDFLSSKISQDDVESTGQLLAPNDFDSGYDSRDTEVLDYLCDRKMSKNTIKQHQQDEIFLRSKSLLMIDNLIQGHAKFQKSVDCHATRYNRISHKKPEEIISQSLGIVNPMQSNAVDVATQTLSNYALRKRQKNDTKLLYTYLLNAAINLSAASNQFFNGNLNSVKHCTKHKKCAFSHRRCSRSNHNCVCSMKHAMGPPLFKRVAELQQQPQCWQCVASDKTPEIKHPTPDLFNRWPNIPPPPAPPAEDDDCQSVCSSNQLVADALPLAAALFHNEPTECCQNINQDEEQQIPPTYPIGVFWDIENCAVPTGKSSLSIVQRVRERFFAGHKEAEFMCVCDINKESRLVIQDLNNAQVNVVHINATAKNAADDKLRQSIRRFAHNHPAPATLVLITGDINFTSEVSDLRHRHKYFVVLIHPANASPSLIQAATTVICYEHLVADLPIVHVSPKTSPESPQPQLLVSNLPMNNDANAVRMRLRQLSDNCGGKVVKLSMGTAVLKFATADAANRALKRLDGEDVFGHSIKVSVLHQSPPNMNAFKNGKPYQNNFSNFSPARHYNNGYHSKPKNRTDNFNIQERSESIVPTSDHQIKPTMNLTPGHCDLPANLRPPFQPHPHYQTPFSIGPPPFPMPPVLNPPPVPYNRVRHSPVYQHSDYNPMPPPPPQPQLFQPPNPERKIIDNQDIGVKLTISNIDAQIGINSIQDCLLKQITDHCKILNMKVRPHNRFTVVCDVIVPHVQDASRVLQHLQRQKIGTKRVLVTLAQQNGEEFGPEEASCLKRDCYILLKDCVGRRMALYRFFNLYEKRFEHKIRLDELKQIPDVVLFRDGSSGREIYINPQIKDESSLEQIITSCPRSGRSTPDINHDFLLPVCKLHYPTDTPRPPSGESGDLLKIEMGLREFSAKLHALLHSHNGILQLDGFEHCYRAEYGIFPFPADIEGGVIVEHQASYVPGVQIITSQPHCLGVKAIVWAQPQSDTGSDTASDTSGASRWKSPNLIHFSREVVELLKDLPYCCLPYDKFNSTYQRTFGHACRVAEYGFTRLSDLLAAIPHVLQIMGSLSNRILTLTHRAQVKRFTQEVVKILKSTPDRAILVAQMPELYNRTFNRAWRLRDYGVSVLSDLLDDIPEGHICTTGEGDNIVLSLPIRERTHEEKERTNQFAREVVKILRTRPHYCMPFTDFVPTYHRQFGRQCKLANYGFTKLIDLFEALPHVVQVLERGTEKLIALTDTEQQKILSIQITSILRAQIPPALSMLPNRSTDNGHKNNLDGPTLPLACVPALFQQKYGFPLVPQDFNAVDIDDLMKKLSHAIKVVVNKAGDKMVKLAERKPIRLLSAQLLALLLDQTSDQLDVEHLHAMYMERFKENIDPSEYGFLLFSDIIRKALPGVVKMDLDAPECLHLKPLYNEARSIRSVLLKNNGTMNMGEFNFAYLTTFQRPVDFERYGFPTFESLLRALPNVLVVKGFGANRTLTLRNHMQFGPLTATSVRGDKSNEKTICGSASMDDLQVRIIFTKYFNFKFAEQLEKQWIHLSSILYPLLRLYHKNMMEFARGSSRKHEKNLVNSASMGDFKSEEENKRRERMDPERSAPNWLPSTRPTVPLYSGSSFKFQYSKPRLPHPMNTFAKSRHYETNSSPVTTSSSMCNFIIGESNSNDTSSSQENQDTPVRRGVSVSVITLPNGSTPIASTSSCSSESTPKSCRSSESSVEYSEDGICSSDESYPSQNAISNNDFPKLNNNGISSLPNSPFGRITATAYVGPLPSMRSNHHRHTGSDHSSPGQLQLAASFPTLSQT